MGDREGAPKASGVAENSGGDCQGVGGGVKSPRGTDTPGVEELLWGDKTSGVIPEGDGVTGTGRQERGGDRNSPATRGTEGSTNTSRGEEMKSNQEPAVLPSKPRGTKEGEIGEVSTQRYSDGTSGVRPEHGALARRKYGLLAPEEPAGDPAATGPQGSGENP